jgi:biotin transport system substrate-specific component
MSSSISSKDITYIALFTSLTIVFSIIPPIPMPLVPVPLTLQTLGVMLAGLVLGPRLALLSMGLYLLIALVGFPVLPGARSGLAVFAGPTGGFLIGFLPGAFVAGWMARRSAQLSEGERSGAQIFAGNLTAAILGGGHSRSIWWVCRGWRLSLTRPCPKRFWRWRFLCPVTLSRPSLLPLWLLDWRN